MATLILLRHAKAVREHEAPSDKDRNLTPRGEQDAAAAGREIVALGLTPSLVLASSAARTRGTLAHAGAVWGGPPSRIEDALYLADVAAIWRLIQPHLKSEETVAVIGHNPGLQDLAAALVAQAHDHSRAARQISAHMPTAAFAAFAVEQAPLEACAPRLLATWSPKD